MTLPEVEAELKAMGIIGVSFAEAGKLIKKLADLKAESAKLVLRMGGLEREILEKQVTNDRLARERDEAIAGQAAVVANTWKSMKDAPKDQKIEGLVEINGKVGCVVMHWLNDTGREIPGDAGWYVNYTNWFGQVLPMVWRPIVEPASAARSLLAEVERLRKIIVRLYKPLEKELWVGVDAVAGYPATTYYCFLCGEIRPRHNSECGFPELKLAAERAAKEKA